MQRGAGWRGPLLGFAPFVAVCLPGRQMRQNLIRTPNVALKG